MHFVDVGESFRTHIYLQNLASIHTRSTSLHHYDSRRFCNVLRYLQFLRIVRFTSQPASQPRTSHFNFHNFSSLQEFNFHRAVVSPHAARCLWPGAEGWAVWYGPNFFGEVSPENVAGLQIRGLKFQSSNSNSRELELTNLLGLVLGWLVGW